MDLKTAEDWKNYYFYKNNSLGSSTEEYLLKQVWCAKIAKLPLAEQCRQLDIAHEKLDGLPYGKKPEIDALNYFAAQGFVGAYCEGWLILLLIHAAALNIFTQLSPKRFLSVYKYRTTGFLAPISREHACDGGAVGQLHVYHEDSDLILNAIRNADVDQVVRHFQEIYTNPRNYYPQNYPGLTAGMISSMFAAIGAERLAQITAAIIENPYSYKSGWPDLTMVKGSDMFWVEIKTTDRLHTSQIMTISRMKSLLPGEVRVVQLTKTRPKHN